MHLHEGATFRRSSVPGFGSRRKPIGGLDKLFDQVAIMSAHSPQKEGAVLGPYFLAENKAGSYILLKRMLVASVF